MRTILIRIYKKKDLDLLGMACSMKRFGAVASKILQDYAKGITYLLPEGSLSNVDRLPESKQLHLYFSDDDPFLTLYDNVGKQQKGNFVKNIIRRYLTINTLSVYCGKTFQLSDRNASSAEASPKNTKKVQKKEKINNNQKQENSGIPKSDLVTEASLLPVPDTTQTQNAINQTDANNEFDMFSALASMADEY